MMTTSNSTRLLPLYMYSQISQLHHFKTMDSSVISPTLLLSFLISASLLISLSDSLVCTSQKFKANKVFSNCTDLPYLKSFLHFTYNSTNSSLSIGFISPPAKPEGWVAWAINPTGTGMIGSQALIAFQSNGSLIVNTYNVSMFPQQSKLSFDVWDLSTESDGKNFAIFATVKVPEGATTVNQVWQVGPSVSKGVPDKHEMGEANKKSVGVLKLIAGGGAAAPAPAPTAVPAPAHGPSSDKKSGVCRIGKSNLLSVLGLLVSLFWFI
ncbi:auxin-induced in root cultures protein 12-like [Euphorbia lathyris]|uniref:auxin-induced in root cultures protein 12-like n=1 Tax=Euphorbia lathyris TaxID=212925 RepID=UPI0033142A3A